MVVADHAELVEHVPRQQRPAVEERREKAQDPQVPIQLEADRVDDLDQVVEALHRVVLRLHRDDHAVGRDQAVHRQEPEIGRAIDQREVVPPVEAAVERIPQRLLASERGEEFAFGGRKVDVGGRHVDSCCFGRKDNFVQRRTTVGQDVCHRAVDGIEIDAQPGSQIGLRIHVDAQNAEPFFCQRARQVDGRRGFADAAFLVRDRDHIRHRGVTSHTSRGASLGGEPNGRRNVTHATPGEYGVDSLFIHRCTDLFTVSVDIQDPRRVPAWATDYDLDRPPRTVCAQRHRHGALIGGLPCRRARSGSLA